MVGGNVEESKTILDGEFEGILEFAVSTVTGIEVGTGLEMTDGLLVS